jgi:vitamin B12 transporter
MGLSAVSLLWCLVGATAPADAAPTALPPVEVPLPPDEGLASSPTRRDPTAATTVIEVAPRRTEVKDASELVASAPGVAQQDAGGAGQRKTMSLRGASPNAVLVLLDGVALGSPGTAVDLSRIPSAMLDRVEVMRGAGSRYGPGGMGGVVNLVSRAPGGTHLFAEASQGSFTTTALSGGGTAPMLGGDGLALVYGLRSEGNFDFRYDATPSVQGDPLTLARRLNNGALQGGGLLRLRHGVGEHATVDVLVEGLAERRGLAGTVQNPTIDASEASERGSVSARLASPFAGGQLSLLGYGRADSSHLAGSPFGSAVLAQVETGVGAEAEWSRLVGRHGVSALVTGGGDWLSVGSKRPSWGRAGAMVGDEVLFFDGKFAVNASARVDVAGPFVVFSPRGGASLQLPYGFALTANAGQASRPPSFVELYVVQGTLLPNDTLRPERALTADATLWWRHPKAAVGVTGFGSFYQDLISYEYYPPTLARPYNFQAAQVSGVEAEAQVSPHRWVELSASYTFMASQNLRDDPRYYLKALPFRPRHRAVGRAVVGPEWLHGHVDLIAQSEQFTNRTETVSLPGRALVNAGVAVVPLQRPQLTVAFEMKNLLDVQAQDVDGYPLPPRAAYLTLAVAWDAANSTRK